MALNDIDGAVESFKKALELEPNDGQWFFLFGILVIVLARRILRCVVMEMMELFMLPFLIIISFYPFLSLIVIEGTMFITLL